jgi:hypothetical protein
LPKHTSRSRKKGAEVLDHRMSFKIKTEELGGGVGWGSISGILNIMGDFEEFLGFFFDTQIAPRSLKGTQD